MKIKELIEEQYGGFTKARPARIINDYANKECVVCYLKEKLGVTMIMKSSKKFFAFVFLRRDIWFGGYDYRVSEIEIKKAREIMGENETIADPNLHSQLNKYLILEGLK